MKQRNNCNIIIKENDVTELFLNNVKNIYENKVILKNGTVVNLDHKHSIRKWIKQNSKLDQIYSRRKYVELSIQIDFDIRQHIEKIQQKQIQEKFKELKKQHVEIIKQIRR